MKMSYTVSKNFSMYSQKVIKDSRELQVHLFGKQRKHATSMIEKLVQPKTPVKETLKIDLEKFAQFPMQEKF